MLSPTVASDRTEHRCPVSSPAERRMVDALELFFVRIWDEHFDSELLAPRMKAIAAVTSLASFARILLDANRRHGAAGESVGPQSVWP